MYKSMAFCLANTFEIGVHKKKKNVGDTTGKLRGMILYKSKICRAAIGASLSGVVVMDEKWRTLQIISVMQEKMLHDSISKQLSGKTKQINIMEICANLQFPKDLH